MADTAAPFDWGSTRRVLTPIVTSLLAFALARWGWDPAKVSDAVNQVFSIVDIVLAASGPLYAAGSQLRAIFADHFEHKVAIAKEVTAQKGAEAMIAMASPVPAPAPTAAPVAP